MSFEVHRVVEYLLGLGLIIFFLGDVGRSPVVGGAGVAVLALAATTRGRFGLLHWWPLALHRALDMVLVVAIAAAPFLVGEPVAAVYLAPAAAVVGLNARRTDYRPARAPGALSRGRSKVATREAATREAASPTQNPKLEHTARKLGRLAGRLVVAARRAADGSENTDQNQKRDKS